MCADEDLEERTEELVRAGLMVVTAATRQVDQLDRTLADLRATLWGDGRG